MSTKDERTVNETVEADTPMKEWLVNYVGEQHEPGDDQVTVEMIVETMAKEFPEFVLALAEENWIRGYQQALDDVTEGEKLYKQELAKAEDENSEE
jgi:uncharacterized iron-regulated protein|tara:strand:+ start:367 stop:654 length:288 start_codon:yes stop_codon:yes gene_type:complete